MMDIEQSDPFKMTQEEWEEYSDCKEYTYDFSRKQCPS